MLELISVSKTFNAGTVNEVRGLRGVDLRVRESSFTVVIGTNGSGKTTLLNAVAGVFPIDDGTIRLGGEDVTRWAEYRRASKIGRVFQNPFTGTSPSLSIAENFALAAQRGRARGLGPAVSRTVRARTREMVRQLNMGLEDRLDTAIGTLSGGQRQALTLLMATWQRPALLLLDEHTAALDPKSADQVIQLTDRIIARDRLAALMVTHSMQQAARYGDRLIMMHRGQILFDVDGERKKRIRAEELLERFEELRRLELLDEGAAEMLAELYV
ncbi:MAG: ATP-binding cassette domain-containing protein [Bryobacteraceae bacterium]|nr:ATP-binding cassette domain-containing protein [Bryobacteraceae bacterium]